MFRVKRDRTAVWRVPAVCGCALLLGALAWAQSPRAQPARIGVLLHGGPYYEIIAGLREELRSLGVREGSEYILEIRDAKGDLKQTEQDAIALAGAGVHVLFTLGGSVSTAAKRVTSGIPIVFCAGTDPVELGLAKSLSQPGDRLTGVHFLQTDATAKRLGLLAEIVPGIRRVITLYDRENKGAVEAAAQARAASAKLGIQLVEQHATSVDDIRRILLRLKPREVDAYFFTSDARIASHARTIIDIARQLKLPTMFQDQSLTAAGALASYGLSFREIGRYSARHMHAILRGTPPQNIPVERVDRLELVLNARTAADLGLRIPQRVLLRADRVLR